MLSGPTCKQLGNNLLNQKFVTFRTFVTVSEKPDQCCLFRNKICNLNFVERDLFRKKLQKTLQILLLDGIKWKKTAQAFKL